MSNLKNIYTLTLITIFGISSLMCYDSYKPDIHLVCEEELNPRTVTFDDLQQYRTTSSSFAKHQENFKGNYVNILDKNITHLVKGDFLTKTSEYIIKLYLNEKNIENITEGAFDFLDCLKYLELQHNKIREVTAFTFSTLPRLMELNLSCNYLEILPASSFEEQNRLIILDLSHNNIRSINKYSFIHLDHLEILDLSFNKLEIIASYDFSSMPVLNNLFLNNNFLKVAKIDEWKNLDFLQMLDLGSNLLNNFNFTLNPFILQIDTLSLANNNISALNVTNLAEHLRYLTNLDINNNTFDCATLRNILDDLSTKSVEVKGKETLRSNLEGIYCIGNGFIPQTQSGNTFKWIIFVIFLIFMLVFSYVFYKSEMVQRCRRRPSRTFNEHFLQSELAYGRF